MPGDITDAYAGDRHDPALALVSENVIVVRCIIIKRSAKLLAASGYEA